MVRAAPGTRGGQLTPGFRERFGQAYDTEFQRWVDAVHRGRSSGDFTDGPSAWDGYAATAVAESCLQALESGRRTTVQLVERPAFYH